MSEDAACEHWPIPWKHGLGRLSDDELAKGEAILDFKFPDDWHQGYGELIAGAMDGWLVFDCVACSKLAVGGFLGPFDPDTREHVFDESLFRRMAASPYLMRFAPSEAPHIPIAVIDCSFDEREQENPWSRGCFLAYERASRLLHVLRSSDGKSVALGMGFKEWVLSCEFWFQGEPPNADSTW
jgi:hypothetical protein